jgi:hypothetical protein
MLRAKACERSARIRMKVGCALPLAPGAAEGYILQSSQMREEGASLGNIAEAPVFRRNK